MNTRSTVAMDRIDKMVDDIVTDIDQGNPVDWRAVNVAFKWETARAANAAMRDSLDLHGEENERAITAG